MWRGQICELHSSISVVILQVPHGSRTITPEENRPPTPKPTLIQSLTLARSQCSSEAIFWLPPTLKISLTVTQTPTLTGGQFSSGEIFWIPCPIKLMPLKTSKKWTRKHLRRKLFFNRVTGLQVVFLFKRDFSRSIFLWSLRNF